MATITVTPTSPVAKSSACRVTVTENDENTATGYDVTKYPSEPAVQCYLAFLKGGVEYGRSYLFSGSHVFNSYIFPSSGSWVVSLKDASDDSEIVAQAVTVS